jgi:hypothetical protein
MPFRLTMGVRSTILSWRSPHVNAARIRIDMKVSDEMNEFLLDEARSRKMSFEGLLISYIEEHMQREKTRRGEKRPR